MFVGPLTLLRISFYCVIISKMLNFRTWIASGDMRQDKDGVSVYKYAINLRGQLDTSQLTSAASSTCVDTTTVCQYKPNQGFARKIAEMSPSYVMTGKRLNHSVVRAMTS